jgi:hypothetical protein
MTVHSCAQSSTVLNRAKSQKYITCKTRCLEQPIPCFSITRITHINIYEIAFCYRITLPLRSSLLVILPFTICPHIPPPSPMHSIASTYVMDLACLAALMSAAPPRNSWH